MRKSSVLCILLAVLMLASVCLVSCNNGGDTEDSSSAVSVDTESNPYYDSATEKYVPTTSGNKYEGETLTFLTCGVNATWTSEIVKNDLELAHNETMPGVLNDAIQQRNDIVFEQLGVTIEEMYIFDGARKNAEMASKIRNNNLILSDEYQVVVPCLYDAGTLSAEGAFYNLLADVPGLQINAPWWDETFNKEVTICGQLYFTIGDIGLINKDSTASLFYNVDLFKEDGLEERYGSIYQLVRDKEWTIDIAYEIMKNYSSDENADGKITYEDIFGWGGQLDDLWSLFYGSGSKIASAGSDGYPELTIYSERSATVVEKMQTLVQDKQHYVSANDYFGVAQWPSVLVQKGFTDGRAMFYNASLGTTVQLGEMEDHYGIIPIPMGTDEQESYYSLVNPWTSTCFAVPKSCPEDKLQMVADVLNVMGAASKNTVAKEYLEKVIKYQKLRDDESIEMMDDYILAGRGCDLGMIYAWGGLDTLLHDMSANAIGTFASSYQEKEGAAQAALDETMNFYKDNE